MNGNAKNVGEKPMQDDDSLLYAFKMAGHVFL